jgi:hypothetical protein
LVVPIPVTNIPVFNPATESAVQASARKANAVKAAIDAAVTAGTLPNTVSATVKPGLVPGVIGKDAFGRPIIGLVPGGLSWIQIGGVTKSVSVGSKAQPDPTKEAGGGGNWQVNPAIPTPTPMTTPSMGGTGSSSGFSSGLDPSGGESVVGFGFWDPTVSNPTLFIAALFPTSGQTDGQVLGDLASLFNANFASAGFTASYNALTDTLSLNQAIPGYDLMWFADSDTGLNFLGDNQPVVPLPGSLILFGSGLLGLVLFGRRKSKATAIAS